MEGHIYTVEDTEGYEIIDGTDIPAYDEADFLVKE
jgi:hypothetical protein